MKKLLLLAIVVATASCNMVFMASNVRKLEIGMTKSQVTNKMGKGYNVVFTDASHSVWEYVDPDPDSALTYVLGFYGDRLETIQTLHFVPPSYNDININDNR